MKKAVILSHTSGELQPVEGWQIRRVKPQEMNGRLPFRPSAFVLRLDNGVDPEAMIERIRGSYPRAGILATGSNVPAERAVRALQAGAHDYVEFNRLVPENLPEILDRVSGLAQVEPERADGKVISVVGPTGTGVTTVSLNLAVAFCSSGHSVLLVSPEPDVPAYLYRLRFNYAVKDFLADVGNSDQADIRGQLTRYDLKGRNGGQIRLLTGAPLDSGEEDDRKFPLTDGNQVTELENFARSQFEYTIVDHGFAEEDGLLPYSDLILLVTDTLPPNVRKARGRLARLPEDPVTELVVNKSTLMGEIRAEDVARQLRLSTFQALPFDAVRAGKAAAAGEPLLVRSPLARIARSYRKLAKVVSDKLRDTGSANRSGEAGKLVSQN